MYQSARHDGHRAQTIHSTPPKRGKELWAILTLLSAFFASPEAYAASERVLTGIASVIDGDTLEIHGDRIRLHAIDAIEWRQRCLRPDGTEWRCGTDAANALADKIESTTVQCHVIYTDLYGRFVAKCYQKGEDLNAWLVAEGWAVAYRQYGQDYVLEEDEAKAAKRGIWASRFIMPWVWRSGQ
ncbi:thermonuclease family protein [Pseudooceanicola sp. 502str34]